MTRIAMVAVVLLAVRTGRAEPDPADEREPDECTDVTVGSPKQKATLCTFVEDRSGSTADEPVYRVVIRKKLQVVRAKKTVTLLDVVTTVTFLDKPRPDSPDLLNLALTIAPDGTSIRLRDAIPKACDNALARIDTAESEPWKGFDHGLVARACAMRGRWVWRGSRFVAMPASRRSP